VSDVSIVAKPALRIGIAEFVKSAAL